MLLLLRNLVALVTWQGHLSATRESLEGNYSRLYSYHKGRGWGWGSSGPKEVRPLLPVPPVTHPAIHSLYSMLIH